MKLFTYILATVAGLTGCALLPSSFQAGVNTDEKLHLSGYTASFRWNLQPRHVVNEEYITCEGGMLGGDSP